jgi:uncharacterized protein
MDIIKKVSEDLKLDEGKVTAAVGLIDQGDTIPFIARYRKEVTGGLTDEDLRNLSERLAYLRKLQERMDAILASITEQGKLTDELKGQIENASTLTELEDLYRPFKPKKKTRASIAKEKGLEPLAAYFKAGQNTKDLKSYIASFINPEKKVNSSQDAVNGALDIIAEDVSDEPKYRKYIKDLIRGIGMIASKEVKKDEKDTYFQYKDYKEAINKIPPHRILALNRGEKEGCLKISLEYDYLSIYDYIVKDYQGNLFLDNYISKAVDDSLKRLILPSVENEIRNDLFEYAETESIEVFKKNLVSLLMYPPLKNKVILGFDPGFRTGCKFALVNENGIPSKVGVFNITSDKQAEVVKARAEITSFLKSNKIDYIALGNGTASRESEAELRTIVKDNNLPIKIHIVNESGASVYSASKLGQEEFPDLPVEKRSAISLARRVQDPLSELVKIEPKAIGVGQYQHDMDQKMLEESLNGVVEDCVNKVGVNLNNASVSLLKYVSGISEALANNIYDYLKTNGKFKNRSELKKVAKMGPKAFEQCAGFLRVYGGDEPLDTTSVHPESYKIAKAILKETKIDLLKDDEKTKTEKLATFNKAGFIAVNQVGAKTLDDILEEIRRPGRDIRDDVKIVELNNEVTDIKGLKVGMVLEGTVRNIMDFGMFVDINVHHDGLVHISEIANHYVKNISELYAIGDVIKVKVISVDVEKQRIGLSIKQLQK